MRRTLVSLIALVSTLVLAAAAAPQAEPPQAVVATTFLISGHGWGHGAGMSQWGARGFAQEEGWTYDRILAYYYPGTELQQAKVAKVRVLLAENAKALAVSSTAPFRVRDAAATTYDLPAGELKIGPDLTLPVDGTPTALRGPLVFQPGSGALLALGGKAYRGELQVVSTGKRLAAIDYVGLEQYVWGVVPGEMPADWPPEALKAQAVAARSYALSQRVKGAGFDLYADVRSQVYLGAQGEDPRTTAAVKATAGRALFYGGKVAIALFSSSSGGQTADSSEVLNEPQPYLVSVHDPHDTLSPWHTWGPVAITAAKVRRALRLVGPVLDMKVVPTPSGRVRAVNVTTGASGATVSGGALRFGLGLRSTWLTIGTLTLQRPGDPVSYGGPLTLSGAIRGVQKVSLQARFADLRAWGPVADFAPAADGTFSVVVRPTATTLYRLAGPDGLGPVLTVPVAPLVSLSRGPGRGVLTGTVAPAVPAALVEIQQLQDDGGWAAVYQTYTDERGAFRARLELVPGAYRAWVAPEQGLAEGISPQLEIAAP
jgi:stage II sporulation protein D